MPAAPSSAVTLFALIHACALFLVCSLSQVPPDTGHPMYCYIPCHSCQHCGTAPLANSCNECCVRQCQSSTVVIEPPAVLVTLPGPILSSFPQNTMVGSSTSAAVGSILSSGGVPISSEGCDLSGLSRSYWCRRFLP
ncbi:feather keratin 3-like [Pseudopipra pipra]|uniref:feather keratin 3-like n=1 Tax=Pseudopipra pipra TaxID=415032 RepID=UPI00313918CB